jgi:hypothetical protein
MKLIYICSPLSGNPENIEKAKKFCRFVLQSGNIPFAPHVYFTQFMDNSNPEDRNLALEMNKQFLEVCDELWVFGKELTEGMKIELEYFVKVKGEDKVRWIYD